MRVAVPVPAAPAVAGVVLVGKAGQGQGARLEDLGANLLQWIGFSGRIYDLQPHISCP